MADPKEIFNKFSLLLMSRTLDGDDDRKELVNLLKQYNQSLEETGQPPIKYVGSPSGGIMTIEEAMQRIEQGDERVINFFREIVEAYAKAEEYL